jgi:hypothetical protein
MCGFNMTKKELMIFLANDVWISIDSLDEKAPPKKQEQWRKCIRHLEELIDEIAQI